MSQATKFYLPFFTTGYPRGKLYTYYSGLDTPAPTYSDSDGTTHTNPVIMDDEGKCILYIDKDITYRYVLHDEFDNQIWEEENIKQMNGDPGTPGGPQGPKGDVGRKGVQGFSGAQGPIGEKGDDGEPGLPYLTKVDVISNQTINLPMGIKEFFITASAGGGAAASWSPYIFMSKKDAPEAGGAYSLNPPYGVSGVLQGYANTGAQYTHQKFYGLVLVPGSGFAGQSVYRKKVSIDSTKANVVQIFIGAGASQSTTDLNGGNGSNTQVYVNGEKVLDLKGGLGGKNFFPKDDASKPVLPTDGTPIRFNRGHVNGMFYFQSSGTDSMSTPGTGQMLYIWPTSYRQKSGITFVYKNIEVSYYAPLQTFSAPQALYSAYTSEEIKGGYGGQGVFGHYYSQYQPKPDVFGLDSGTYHTATKTGQGLQGWGSGGDIYFNTTSAQNLVSDYFGATMFAKGGSGYPGNLVIFDEKYIKSRIRTYMNQFTVTDSFSPGVTSVPTDDDTSGVWQGIYNVRDFIDGDPANYLKYIDSGFYKPDGVIHVEPAYRSDARGGQGVDGFAVIEFGSINEVIPS